MTGPVNPEFALGKQPHKEDPRSLMLANFLEAPITGIPVVYDFERTRRPFPVHMWGNDQYGDCVRAARANHQQRLQRVETRQTIPMTDQMIVDGYKTTTGCQSPGDLNDTGLVMLDDLKLWRAGWHLPVWDKGGRTYKINAFGLLDQGDKSEMKSGCFLLGGVQFGLDLPITSYRQLTDGHQWSVVSTTGEGRPGSWGGHCVYSCCYDTGGWYVWTWGKKQYMTDEFVSTYADEVWAVVQANETNSRYIDVVRLYDFMRSIGIHPIA